MSALTTQRTRTRVLLLAVFTAISLLTPQFVDAATHDATSLGVEHLSCGDYSVTIRAHGAGLIAQAKPLETSDRRVLHINNEERCAVIAWRTKTPATSQVLFGKLKDEPVAIDTTNPKLGYSRTTPQNNAGIAHHVAILTDLEPNTAYAYRIVNRAIQSGMPTLGEPLVFITGSTGELTFADSRTSTPETTEHQAPEFAQSPAVTRTTDETTRVHTRATSTVPHDKESTATTSGVPSALQAAERAFPESRESALWSSITGFVSLLDPVFAPSGERRNYIIPTIVALALLLIVQRYGLPLVGISLSNTLMFWIVVSVVLTLISAAFMFYYVSLLGIALFLALLAWYLIQSAPDDEEAESPQLKLLESKDNKDNSPKSDMRQ